MIDYMTIVILILSVILAVTISNSGFLGLQHQKLIDDIKKVINSTETENHIDRAQSDNQTRYIIFNITAEASNSTKVILKNMTTQRNQQFEILKSDLDRLSGIEVRIHNDVQQLLERDNERNNETSGIVDILPDFG